MGLDSHDIPAADARTIYEVVTAVSVRMTYHDNTVTIVNKASGFTILDNGLSYTVSQHSVTDGQDPEEQYATNLA